MSGLDANALLRDELSGGEYDASTSESTPRQARSSFSAMRRGSVDGTSAARRRASIALDSAQRRCQSALDEELQTNSMLRDLLALVSANDQSVIAMRGQLEALSKQRASKLTSKKDRDKMDQVIATMQSEFDLLVTSQRSLRARLDQVIDVGCKFFIYV